MKEFWSLFAENLRAILKSKDLRSIVLVGPIMYGVLIPSIYCSRRVNDVAIGVVDLDQSRLSRQVARMMDATEGASLRSYYTDLEQGKVALNVHEVHGLLFFPRNFEQRFKKRLGTSAALAVSSSNLTLAGPLVSAASAVSSTVSGASVIGLAQSRGIHRSKASTLAQPIRLDMQPLFNPALNYADATVPGLLFVILQQIVIVGLCFSIAELREKQLLRHKPQSKREALAFVLATILPYSLINLVLSIIYLAGLEFVFDIPAMNENLPLAYVLCGVFGLATASLGFLLSHIFKDRMTVLITLLFYSLPGFFSSGYSWPTQLLTLDVRIFGYLFPITYFADEIRRLYLGPIGLSSYLSSFFQLIGFFAVCMIINILLLRRGVGLSQASEST